MFRNKNAQITIFIILGIIIISGFFLMTSLNNEKTEKDFSSEDFIGSSIGQRFDKASIEEYYLKCIEDLANDGLILYSPDRLISFIEDNIIICSSIQSLYPEIYFQNGNPEVSISKSTDGNFYAIDVDYDISMKGDDFEDSLSSFSLRIPIGGEYEFKLNPDNITARDDEIVILGGRVKVAIPKDIKPIYEGETLEKIEFKIVKEGDSNLVVEFSPKGAVFARMNKNPIQLKISYQNMVFPDGFDESRLKIGYFDKEFGKFMIVEGSKANTSSKQIIGDINHFSRFTWGVVRFEGECDDGVGWNYTEFYELVKGVYSNITSNYVNGSVNNTLINKTIMDLFIDVKKFNIHVYDLYLTNQNFNGMNLTNFSIYVDLTNITVPLSVEDSYENCSGSKNLSITHEYDRSQISMWVGNPSKGKPAIDSTHISVDMAGQYAIFGIVNRIEFGDECQAGEEFQLQINGISGEISKDDPNACRRDQDNLDYLGQFALNQGTNAVNMVYTGTTPSGNSVSLNHMYVNILEHANATYFWIDNDGNEVRFYYQTVLPRVKSLSLDVEVVGETSDMGFMSLFVYNDKLYAGTYDITSGKPKVYSYPEWKEEAALPAGESVFAFEEFKGNLYAVTEDEGKLFISTDGSNFKVVKTSVNNLGLGIVEFKEALYSTFTSYAGNTGKGPILYKSSDGSSFAEVEWPPTNQKCVVYAIKEYKDKLYASTFCGSKTKVYTTSDGNTWILLEEVEGVKSYKILMNNKFYGIHKKGGVSTIFEYDGTNSKEILNTNLPIGNGVEFDGNLYFSTSNCWKDCALGLRAELYRLDFTKRSLEKVYSFNEPNIGALAVFQGGIYAATRSGTGGNGKIYKINVNKEAGDCITDDINISGARFIIGTPNLNEIPIVADLDVVFLSDYNVRHEITYKGGWPEFNAGNIRLGEEDFLSPLGQKPKALGICWNDTIEKRIICEAWDWTNPAIDSPIKQYRMMPGKNYGIFLVSPTENPHSDFKNNVVRTKIKWVTWPETHKYKPENADKPVNKNAGTIQKIESTCNKKTICDEIDISKISKWNTNLHPSEYEVVTEMDSMSLGPHPWMRWNTKTPITWHKDNPGPEPGYIGTVVVCWSVDGDYECRSLDHVGEIHNKGISSYEKMHLIKPETPYAFAIFSPKDSIYPYANKYRTNFIYWGFDNVGTHDCTKQTEPNDEGDIVANFPECKSADDTLQKVTC